MFLKYKKQKYVPERKSNTKTGVFPKRKQLFEDLENRECRYRNKPPEKSFLSAIEKNNMRVVRNPNFPHKKFYVISDSSGHVHGWMQVKGDKIYNWHVR